MSKINILSNEPGDAITITNPNSTITSFQSVVGNFSDENFRLQGLEKRNFAVSSVTNNMPGTNVKSFASRTGVADGTPLGFFNGSFFVVGPVTRDMANKETFLSEMSAGFEMSNSNNGTWPSADNLATLWPELEFSLGFADNPNGQGVTTISGTRRMFRTAVYETSSGKAFRNIAGSVTIVISFAPIVSSQQSVYIYMQVQDNHYANVVNYDASKLETLTIHSSRMHIRKYKK